MRGPMPVKIPDHYRLALLLPFYCDARNREVREHQRTPLSAIDA
jgi:hypothetical protein